MADEYANLEYLCEMLENGLHTGRTMLVLSEDPECRQIAQINVQQPRAITTAVLLLRAAAGFLEQGSLEAGSKSDEFAAVQAKTRVRSALLALGFDPDSGD